MSVNHLRAKMSGVHLAQREYGREGSCRGCGRIGNSAGAGVVRGGGASSRFTGAGGRHRYAMPPTSSHEKLRRHQAAGSREVLRRALMPVSRRPSLRWWNFRPTPSRLCNMSMAA